MTPPLKKKSGTSMVEPSGNVSDQEDVIPFPGRKFYNLNNDCYVISVMNFIMSSEKFREGIIENLCQCTLCKNLRIFLGDPTTIHRTKLVKDWGAILNPTIFGGVNLNKQQDVEEFLTFLIENCENLKKKTRFETQSLRKCENGSCLHESEGPIQKNRTIMTCHMNTGGDGVNITEDMVSSNVSINYMICEKCNLIQKKRDQDMKLEKFFQLYHQNFFLCLQKDFNTINCWGRDRKLEILFIHLPPSF